MNKWTAGRVGIISLVTFALVGCSAGDDQGRASDTPASATEVQGLSLEMAENGHLRGTFTQDGVTISFEAIRGESHPHEVTADKSAPEYAVDARFFTDKGASFLVSSGGHGLEKEDWAREDASFDPAARTAALRLVQPLVEALTGLDVPDDLLLERNRLVDLGGSIDGVELVREPTGDTSYACTNSFVHQMAVRNKAAFDTPWGNHTAVYVDSWFLGTSCTWLYVGRQESCNHGTCATNSAMSTACTWESGHRAYSFPAFQVYSAYGNGACSSFYNPWSNGGGHNCNDDAYFQIWNIRNDTYYLAATGPSNICTDSTTHSYSPSCSGVRGAP